MAKPGRKPKPVELRLLEGNREHRPIPKVVKAAPELNLSCPKWIIDSKYKSTWRKIAKEEYEKTSKILFDLGLFTKVDHAALEAYSVCYAKWCLAEFLAEIEFTQTNNGNYQPNPMINIAHKYRVEMSRYIALFGLAPSARIQVSPVDNEGDDWGGILD